MPEPTLLQAVQSQMIAYFEHLGRRIEDIVRVVPEDKLWARPFPFGNSVGHLVLHITGSLSHYIGAGVAGTEYVRDRPGEFTVGSGQTADEILGPFREVFALLIRTLQDQDEAGLSTPYTLGGPLVENRFGIFLVCATHVNNHIGQMNYLLHALEIGRDEKVW